MYHFTIGQSLHQSTMISYNNGLHRTHRDSLVCYRRNAGASKWYFKKVHVPVAKAA